MRRLAFYRKQLDGTIMTFDNEVTKVKRISYRTYNIQIMIFKDSHGGGVISQAV